MPTNSAVRETLPPKRSSWAVRYWRSKISRASRSGRPSDVRRLSPAGVAAAPRRSRRAACRRRSVVGASPSGGSSAARRSCATAGVARPVLGLQHRQGIAPMSVSADCWREICSMKWLTSDRHILAPFGRGTRSGTTDRRWNRSARNTPSSICASRSRARGDDADIDRRAACRRRAGILLDQDAQQLVLRLARHAGDLGEIERAAMGPFRARRPCASAAVGLGAEQLHLHASGVIVAALKTTNGPPCALAIARGSARAQPLAGAGAPEMKMRLLVGATFSICCRS